MYWSEVEGMAEIPEGGCEVQRKEAGRVMPNLQDISRAGCGSSFDGLSVLL